MLDLTRLNEAQRRAVTHPGGPAIVLAGPGSGKTFLIVNRIIFLIEEQKVMPGTILVITFTKAAAYSMQRRFEMSTGGCYPGVRFGTFHSFFYEILKEYDSYHDNSIFKTEPDFDAMENSVVDLLSERPWILSKLREQYKFILVDEYQDTGILQEKILSMLCGETKEIMVVGDDDQAIYGFRGSKPDVMKNYIMKYPDAKTYYLNINYRSTQSILEASMAVINQNKNRFYKELRTKNEKGDKVNIKGFESKNREFEYILSRITELSSRYSFSDMAVITRGNREQEGLCLFLKRKGIPCNRKRKEKNTVANLVFEEIVGCLEFIAGVRERAPDVWNKMNGNEKKRKLLEKQVPISAIHFICKVMGYEKELEQYAEDLEQGEGAKREAWLMELKNVLQIIKEHAKNYSSIFEWIPMLKMQLPRELQDTSGEGVHIMTMHGSKGLEFSYVCIMGANEGTIPGKRSRKNEEIEEERRLLYVAMTRAKKILDILYLTGTPDYPRLPSRFLNPLLEHNYSSSSTNSSNSTLSKNSSKASATVSYSSSSSMKINSGSTLGSLSSSRYP